jgi:hypothetical protein
MDLIVKTADKMLSNINYDTTFKIDNVKKELLEEKYKLLLCQQCVDAQTVKERKYHQTV